MATRIVKLRQAASYESNIQEADRRIVFGFLYRAGIAIALIIIALSASLSMLAGSEKDSQGYMLFHAMKYQWRYLTSDSKSKQPFAVVSGKIANATYYDGSMWVLIRHKESEGHAKTWFNLANIETKAKEAKAVRSFLGESKSLLLTIEIYFDGNVQHALLYHGGSILNLQLIEAGLAEPSSNPITKEIDKIYAEYYWKKLKASQ